MAPIAAHITSPESAPVPDTQPQDVLADIHTLIAGLKEGRVLPYLGPGVLSLIPDLPVPASPEVLVGQLTAKATVPHKIRNRLTQAAQFIENFKHRKSVVQLMNEAFATTPAPSALHLWLAKVAPPMVVESWYDDTLTAAYAQVRPQGDWGQVQGLSQSEHFGTWTAFYDAQQALVTDAALPASWASLVYRPIGGRQPAGNYLVSDSDYVEVLTEIDIQTPIPQIVQERRASLGFVFLGCRFNDQLPRSFARQIMKRSGGPHYAVMAEPPTRMESRFFEEQGITLSLIHI